MYRKTGVTNSPKSPRGVNFYQQFARSFIRPYGLADEAPTPETVFRRLKPFNCEWLIRPNIALSELSETISKNTAVVVNDETGTLSDNCKKFWSDNMNPLIQCLSSMQRDSESCTDPTDVVNVLKFLFKPNDNLDEAMDTFFHIGGAMFVSACQYIIARTLVRQPEAYAELVQAENGGDKQFQSEKDIASMTNFIVKSVISSTCRKASVDTSDRRNLLSAFDSVLATTKDSNASATPLSSPPASTSSFSFKTVSVKKHKREGPESQSTSTSVEAESPQDVLVKASKGKGKKRQKRKGDEQ